MQTAGEARQTSPHTNVKTHTSKLAHAQAYWANECVHSQGSALQLHAYIYTLSPGVALGLQCAVSVCGLVLLTTLWCKYTAANSWPPITTIQ